MTGVSPGVPRINVWPPLPLGVYARKPSAELPFPLRDSRCRIFSMARQGLFAAVGAIGLKPGDEVLTPAYHHGSEIEALIRAGLVCRFYDAGDGLAPEEERLEALLGSRARALYLTHYLGLPQNAARWREWCDERNLLLIEDAAQAWLGSRDGLPVGSHADVAIFCLYKTFGIPDGAAVISSTPPPAPRAERGIGIEGAAMRHVLDLAQRRSGIAGLLRRFSPPPGEYDPAEDFALGDPGRAARKITGFLLTRLASQEAQKARSANYARLLEKLGRFVPDRFAKPVEGASPFAFPVFSNRKKETLGRLARSGVHALDFWSVAHPSLRTEDFPRAAELRGGVIALPVHQGLGDGELDLIARATLGEMERG